MALATTVLISHGCPLPRRRYFTAGDPEVRAWTVQKGCKAPQAAGVIHKDFERGFIKAEVVSFEVRLSGSSRSISVHLGRE